MAASTFAAETVSVIVVKIGSLKSGGIPTTGDLKTSIDITPQVAETSVYQSIFTPYIKAEFAIIDPIGLFVNFPLSGEEAVFYTYREIATNQTHTIPLIIDTVNHIVASDKNKDVSYMINCSAIESVANAKQTIQQAYHDTAPNTAKKIFQEHIEQRTKKLFPGYTPMTLFTDNNDSLTGTIVIPNMLPLEAMKMVSEIYVSQTKGHNTVLFYQNFRGFNFTTMQSLYDPNTTRSKRRVARLHNYKYLSDEINATGTTMQNDGRVITKLSINKRYSSLEKIALGYYHNVLFDINIAQKSIHCTPTKIEDTLTMHPHQLSTQDFTTAMQIEGDEEQSNRTRYVVNMQRENDTQFPVSVDKYKWGKDTQSLLAMGQIDLTVVIPGTTFFNAGDLFYAELPEIHSFNEMKDDDLISGMFLVVEVKHIFLAGGIHSTVLRINRDSYSSSIDRPSRYD